MINYKSDLLYHISYLFKSIVTNIYSYKSKKKIDIIFHTIFKFCTYFLFFRTKRVCVRVNIRTLHVLHFILWTTLSVSFKLIYLFLFLTHFLSSTIFWFLHIFMVSLARTSLQTTSIHRNFFEKSFCLMKHGGLILPWIINVLLFKISSG